MVQGVPQVVRARGFRETSHELHLSPADSCVCELPPHPRPAPSSQPMSFQSLANSPNFAAPILAVFLTPLLSSRYTLNFVQLFSFQAFPHSPGRGGDTSPL